MPRLPMLLLPAVAAALAFAAPASAATYCIGEVAAACDFNKAATNSSLTESLDAAEAADGPDTIRIGPGHFSGNFSYGSAGELDIVGSGRTTVIEGAGDQPALAIVATGQASTVSGLDVRLASVPLGWSAVGLRLTAAAASDVHVENPHDSPGAAVQLGSFGRLEDSVVTAGAANGIESAWGGGAGDRYVTGVAIGGERGIVAEAGIWHLRGLKIGTRLEGVTSSAVVNLSNSLVRVTGPGSLPGTGTGLVQTGTGTLTADHVTLTAGKGVRYGAYVGMSPASRR